MKVFWSDFASEMLLEAFNYHKEKASLSIAQKIKSDIFKITKQLKKHPKSGQIEPSLLQLNEGHRYLVVGNY